MSEVQTPVGRVVRQQVIQPYTRIPKRFYQGQLGTSTAALYTAPSAPTIANSVGLNPKSHIKQIRVCNTDSAAQTFTMYIVASGGSASASNMIHNAVSLDAGEDYIYDNLEDILEAGDAIHGKAGNASKITVTISGDDLV